MIAIDEAVLEDIAPTEGGNRASQQASIIGALGGILASTLDNFEINTGLRAAHFLGQVCRESDGFCTTVEYASGQAYESRADLGNTQPGDGPRYKGRGLIQLTGRSNYQTYGAKLDIDLINKPELAAEPKIALIIACQFWKQRDLNSPADKDDIITITKRINGGLNGLEQRRAYVAKAKAALSRPSAAEMALQAAPMPAPAPVS